MTMPAVKGRPGASMYDNNVYCTKCEKWIPRKTVKQRCPACNNTLRVRARKGTVRARKDYARM